MENKLSDIRSSRNPKSRIKVMEGHFVTSHSHINLYIDMSTVKHRHNNAKETAKVLAEQYLASRSIDTIVCMDGTELIAAYMAEILADPSNMISINSKKNISVITPEYNNVGQMIFRNNTQRMIKHMQVLLLSASTTTGKTIDQAVECVTYYEGTVCGIASIFSAVDRIHGIDVNAVFHSSDLPAYETYSHYDCPHCKRGQKVDAIVNSYGYSILE